jgi:hypothetical protein
MEQVNETVVETGDENGNRGLLVRKSQFPLHRKTLGNGLKPAADFRLSNRKIREVPFNPREELLSFKVNVMIGVQDVAAMTRNEISNVANQALTVWTLYE